MSLDAIKTITAAEDAARRVKAEAADRAKRLVSEAEAGSVRAMDEARERAARELRELNNSADSQAAESARLLEQDTRRQISQLRGTASARLDEAAALIVERIVKS